MRRFWYAASAAATVAAAALVLAAGCSRPAAPPPAAAAAGTPPAPSAPGAATVSGIQADMAKVQGDPSLSAAQKEIMLKQMQRAQAQQQSGRGARR